MSAFAVVIRWLSTFWSWVETGFAWILDGFILLLQFVVFTILDGLFTVVETVLSTLNLSAIALNYAATWSNLPAQLIWLINAVGLPQCLSLLGGAYLIRMVLNLIPSVFTRI